MKKSFTKLISILILISLISSMIVTSAIAGNSGNTKIIVHDVPAGVTRVVINMKDPSKDVACSTPGGSNLWKGPDGGEYVSDSILGVTLYWGAASTFLKINEGVGFQSNEGKGTLNLEIIALPSVKYSVTYNFLDKADNTHVLKYSITTDNYLDEDEYDIPAEAAGYSDEGFIPGYTFDSANSSVFGEISGANVVVNLYYNKTQTPPAPTYYTVTYNFLDSADNSVLKAQLSTGGYADKADYDIHEDAKNYSEEGFIPGYTYDSASASVFGKINGADVVVNLYYVIEEIDITEAETPLVEEPAVKEPAVEEPAVEEPAVEEPAVEEPAVEEPAVEEPAVEEPAVEEPAVEEPVDEEPIVEITDMEVPMSDVPQTGDSSNIILFAAISVLSALGLVIVIAAGRKKEDHTK